MTPENDLAQWLKYLETLHSKQIDLGLDRVAKVAKTLNLLAFDCPVITVAGTNGKGSCVRILESIYLKAGYQVAAYTSPHFVKFNERIRLNGREVSDQQLLSSFVQIESVRGEQPLSFFEFTTLAALKIFQQTKPDVVLLEVGLGGRLDAVNIVDSDVALISSIGLDHCDWLGKDRESIGFEKAGIMRPHKPAVCADLNPPATLIEHAKYKNTILHTIHEAFSFTQFEDNWSWRGDHHLENLPIPRLKIENAAACLKAIECLQNKLPVTEEAIHSGLKCASLPGRFEKLDDPVPCILDVAHNPQSAQWLAEQLHARKYTDLIAVVGILADKDVSAIIAPIIPFVDQWYVAGLKAARPCGSEMIMKELTARHVKKCYNLPTVSAAMDAAKASLQFSQTILVYGSFYTVGAVKEIFLAGGGFG